MMQCCCLVPSGAVLDDMPSSLQKAKSLAVANANGRESPAPSRPSKTMARDAKVHPTDASETSSRLARRRSQDVASPANMHPESSNSSAARLLASLLSKKAEPKSWWEEQMSAGMVQDHYNLGRVLGKGAYSTVFEGICNESNERFAVKVIKLKGDTREALQKQRDKILSEVYLTHNLRHKNLLHLEEFFLESSKIVMVLELMRGGSLFDEVLERGGYSENDTKVIFQQILSALDYLHNQDVVHRDIKLENLLLEWPNDLNSVKIADLGFAVQLQGGPAARRTMAGTPAYLAPEMILCMQRQRTLDQVLTGALDMWAAGVALYLLLGGYPPFEGETSKELFTAILRKQPNFDAPLWQVVSPPARDLITQLLSKDPMRRITAAEALSHPWFHEATTDTRRVDGGQAPNLQDSTLDQSFKELKKYISLSRTSSHAHRVLSRRDRTTSFIKPSFFLGLQNRHGDSWGSGLDRSLRRIFSKNKQMGPKIAAALSSKRRSSGVSLGVPSMHARSSVNESMATEQGRSASPPPALASKSASLPRKTSLEKAVHRIYDANKQRAEEGGAVNKEEDADDEPLPPAPIATTTTTTAATTTTPVAATTTAKTTATYTTSTGRPLRDMPSNARSSRRWLPGDGPLRTGTSPLGDEDRVRLPSVPDYGHGVLVSQDLLPLTPSLLPGAAQLAAEMEASALGAAMEQAAASPVEEEEEETVVPHRPAQHSLLQKTMRTSAMEAYTKASTFANVEVLPESDTAADAQAAAANRLLDDNDDDQLMAIQAGKTAASSRKPHRHTTSPTRQPPPMLAAGLTPANQRLTASAKRELHESHRSWMASRKSVSSKRASDGMHSVLLNDAESDAAAKNGGPVSRNGPQRALSDPPPALPGSSDSASSSAESGAAPGVGGTTRGVPTLAEMTASSNKTNLMRSSIKESALEGMDVIRPSEDGDTLQSSGGGTMTSHEEPAVAAGGGGGVRTPPNLTPAVSRSSRPGTRPDSPNSSSEMRAVKSVRWGAEEHADGVVGGEERPVLLPGANDEAQ